MSLIACKCEDDLREHIPVKDVCLLIREYVVDVNADEVINFLHTNAKLGVKTWKDFWIHYDLKNKTLTASICCAWACPTLSDTVHTIIATCEPKEIAQHLQRPKPLDVLMPGDKYTLDAITRFTIRVGRRMSDEIRAQCH